MSDAGEAREVGSFSDEAAKLLDALSEWARDHAHDAGGGLSGLAEQNVESAQVSHEHLASGSPECTVCPLCRSVHAVRQLSPEVKSHLASALTSLTQAAAAVMTPSASTEDRGNVEHIHLADEWPS